jgi:hypothetical protein
MRNRNLTMGEMAQFMAQQDYGNVEFARQKRKGKSSGRLKRIASIAGKTALASGAGVGLYAGATKTRLGQRLTGGAIDRFNKMRGAYQQGPMPPKPNRKK